MAYRIPYLSMHSCKPHPLFFFPLLSKDIIIVTAIVMMKQKLAYRYFGVVDLLAKMYGTLQFIICHATQICSEPMAQLCFSPRTFQSVLGTLRIIDDCDINFVQCLSIFSIYSQIHPSIICSVFHIINQLSQINTVLGRALHPMQSLHQSSK